jgi:photosystem II stability/assembly factor-like uncharacterized protein
MKKLIYTLVLLAFAVSLNAQWSQLTTGTTTTIESIAVTDANTVYFVGGDPPNTFINMKTTNGGLNWFSFASPSSGGVSVYFLNANTGFLDGMTNLQMTTNAGNNWANVYTSTDTAVFLSFHFPNANTGYGVGMKLDNSFNFINSAAIKTTNGGLNWTRLAPPINGANNELIDVFFTDANTGYAVGWGSNSNILLKTINGGNNWNSIGPISINAEMYSVKFTDQNTGYVCGSSQIGLLKTTNAGVNWNNIYSSGNPRITDTYFINANTGFAIGDDGIMRTNNAGLTWTNQNNTYTNNVLKTVVFYGNYAGYVCGKNGLMVKTTNGGSVFVQNISTEIPSAYSLSQNYPNPFNPSTVVRFQLSVVGLTTLKVFDMMGREVQTLVNERLQPGTYETKFDGSQLTSGVYFYKIISGDYVETKKMLLLK